MARLMAVVIAALLAGGCQTYGGSKAVAIGGGAVMLGALVIGASAESGDSTRDTGDAMATFIVLGVIMGLCGLGGMVLHGSPDRTFMGAPPPPMMVSPPPMGTPPRYPMGTPPPVENDPDRRRRAAWDLTQQARNAAYANDCARVSYLAQRVIELDRQTFDTVFSRDPYIVKCAPAPQRPADPPPAIPIPPLDPTPPPAP